MKLQMWKNQMKPVQLYQKPDNCKPDVKAQYEYTTLQNLCSRFPDVAAGLIASDFMQDELRKRGYIVAKKRR